MVKLGLGLEGEQVEKASYTEAQKYSNEFLI